MTITSTAVVLVVGRRQDEIDQGPNRQPGFIRSRYSKREESAESDAAIHAPYKADHAIPPVIFPPPPPPGRLRLEDGLLYYLFPWYL